MAAAPAGWHAMLKAETAPRWSREFPVPSNVPSFPENSPWPSCASRQELSPNFGNSTIQKQREAFQPLVAELQDADKELSDIVVAHQSDHLSWEGNQRKIPTLAEQCNILKNEVNKRNETIKSLTLKLDKMSQEITDATIQRQALEKENQSLEHDVLELSIKRGQLQAKERMLLAMLKMKDEVILERIDHITKFTTKFGQLASALHAAKIEKLSLNKENEDLKVRLRDLTPEAGMLKDHLSEKVKENKKQHEEIAHLKEENSSLREEAAIALDRVRRQDQLLKSAKTKQAQTDTELSRLRQICARLQHDLQFLCVSLETSQKLMQKSEKAAFEWSLGMMFPAPKSDSKTDTVRTESTHRMFEECRAAHIPKSRVETTSEMPEADNRLLQNASDLEETTSAHLKHCQVVKGWAVLPEEGEEQDVASSFGELSSQIFSEANNTRPLGYRDVSGNGVESRHQRPFESSFPKWERCLASEIYAASCVDPQSTMTLSTILSDKAGCDNKTWEETPGILCDQRNREPPAVVHKSESDSCSSFITEEDECWTAASPDPEWLEPFKPIKGDGSVCQGKDCSCHRTAQETKRASSKSEEDVNPILLDLDPPCFTFTQKGESPQRWEKFSDGDIPLESSSLSGTKPTRRCCTGAVDRDTSSPVSKLKRLLAVSRQMVADPELNALLQATPHCSPIGSSGNMTAELGEAPQRTRVSAAGESDAKPPYL